MMTAVQLTSNIKSYIISLLDSMSKSTPIVGLMKPLIIRALDKNICKISKALDFVSDNNGNIDIENILSEMMDNIVNSSPFIINTSFIGDVEIGGGCIKFNLPLTNKRIMFDSADLETFKQALISK